jgi:hypothetical protein
MTTQQKGTAVDYLVGHSTVDRIDLKWSHASSLSCWDLSELDSFAS